MITQEYLVSDLELRLSKSKPSQDLDITYGQMAYWIDQARDSITRESIKDSKYIDASIVMTTPGSFPYLVDDKYYVDLGVIPLDLYKGSGVLSVYNEYGDFIFGQSLSNKKRNSLLAFAKPSRCNIVYTLMGSSIMLSSGKPEDIDLETKYFIDLVPSELSRVKQKSDRLYILPSTQEAIIEMAEEIGLRELTGRSIYDISDDGLGNKTE